MRLLSSLTNRIFLASALLALLAVGWAAFIVNERATREAEADLQRGLVESGSVVDQQRTVLVDTFLQLARLIADLPKLKAAVATGDPPTIAPIARDYYEQIRSDLFVVTGRSGRVLAAVGADQFSADFPGVAEALHGVVGSAFWPHQTGILHVVTVPITIGEEVLGSLAVGFLLDDRVAAQFKSVTGSDIAFAADGHVLASTLPPSAAAALAPLIGREGISRLAIGGEEFIALRHPLASRPAAGASSGDTSAAGTPVAILLRSRTERLRYLSTIRTGLAGTAIAAVLIATIVSYGVARTITRPLAAITDTMREMARTGDLGRKVTLRRARWDDEDAQLLASTLNAMTDSIARFQRDAAQRERLSSLGRLSTVVAHEIRNPLMIIKAALRTLRREDARPDDVREAVRDIDEETTRLNRIVTEVLDFARPIRFDLAPTDLNAVCRASAAAAAADGGEPSVALALAPDLPEVVCDPERLRTALVNMLANARHAVQARAQAATPRAHAGAADPAPDVAAADVVLETRPVPPDRVLIAIRDRGVGIAPDDLAHVFDPYFTTRRAGTGLGLPIAKNIVEGLGGSITITSRHGEGTEVRIELPVRPSAA